MTLEELLKQKEEIDKQIEEIHRSSAQEVVGEISELVQKAYDLIQEAESLAKAYNLDFTFSLGYGMGGQFNGKDWDASDFQGERPRTGGWLSSSASC